MKKALFILLSLAGMAGFSFMFAAALLGLQSYAIAGASLSLAGFVSALFFADK